MKAVAVSATIFNYWLLATLTLSGVPAAALDIPEMQKAMRTVFSNMQVLVELSSDPAKLAAQGSQATVLDATTALEAQASLISSHVPRDEISSLASSLDRYSRWIRESYEWGMYDDTRRLVLESIDVCVACHTRVPSRGDSSLADDFMNSARIERLPARQQVRLQTATRRFDDALNAYTSLLDQAVEDRDFEELARDFLVLTLRVKADVPRAQRVLASLLENPALDGVTREHVTEWFTSLQRLAGKPVGQGGLQRAALLVEQVEGVGAGSGKDGLVNYIVASGLLYAYLAQFEGEEKGQMNGTVQDGAQAYYLLGLTQHRITPEAWLPQSELFLEKAIRTAPYSVYARSAYDLLATLLHRTYPQERGGLPRHIRAHIQVLADMVK